MFTLLRLFTKVKVIIPDAKALSGKTEKGKGWGLNDEQEVYFLCLWRA